MIPIKQKFAERMAMKTPNGHSLHLDVDFQRFSNGYKRMLEQRVAFAKKYDFLPKDITVRVLKYKRYSRKKTAIRTIHLS